MVHCKAAKFPKKAVAGTALYLAKRTKGRESLRRCFPITCCCVHWCDQNDDRDHSHSSLLSVLPLACQKAPSFLFIITWKGDSRKNRTGVSSPWNTVFSWPDPPLINRHFFETPPRHFSLTLFKCHANEGDMHSGLFQEARKGCYFACMYCWFQSSFFQYCNDF